MELAKERWHEDESDTFGMEFRIEPTWRYVNDPSNWHSFYHAERPDVALFIEHISNPDYQYDEFYVGLYRPSDGEVLEHFAETRSFGKAVTHLFAAVSSFDALVEEHTFGPSESDEDIGLAELFG
jgi:hypothetical protein